MMALDCESFESALVTSAGILGIDPSTLLHSLRGFVYDKVPEAEQRERPFQDLLVLHSVGIEPCKLPVPPSICWFHATRVLPTTTFSEGILPLSKYLNRIWSSLGALTADWITIDEWQSFRQNMKGHGAQQYHVKRSHGVISEGPFAFLVREGIFRCDEAWSHDYLAMPEIIGDICLSFEETFGHNLRDRFLAETKPCIVKFCSDWPAPGALPAALTYLHRITRGESFFLECNTCYSGEGEAIKPEAIQKLEWIEQSDA